MSLGTAGLIAGGLGLLGGNSNSSAESYGYSNQDAKNWSNSSSYQEAMNQANAMSWNSAEDIYNAESIGNSWTDAKTANIIAMIEAQKNREFQQYMSNTAYQRAVNDLKLAGLNPILAYYNGGSGASTPNGATAQTFMNSYSSSKSNAKSYGYSKGGSKSESYGYSQGGSTSSAYGYNNSKAENWSNSKSASGIQQIFNGLGNYISSQIKNASDNSLLGIIRTQKEAPHTGGHGF